MAIRLYATQGDSILSDDMLEVLNIITPLDTCGHFIHTGYFLVTVLSLVSTTVLRVRQVSLLGSMMA